MARGLDVVGLAVSEIDHRRDDEKIGRPLLEGLQAPGSGGMARSIILAEAGKQAPRGPALQTWNRVEGPERAPRQAPAASRHKGRRIIIFGLEIAQVVP